MMAFRRCRFDNHFAAQDFFFRRTDFGVAHHAAFEQQIPCCRPHPAIDGDWCFTFTRPGNHPAHPLHLSMHILNGFYGLIEQFAERVGNQFGSRILDQIRFTRLGNQRKRQRIDRCQTAVGAPPAGRFNFQVAAHPFQGSRAPHQRSPSFIHIFRVAMFNAQLH